MEVESFGLAVKRLNHSATLSDQSSFNRKLNRNKEKLKQSCFASNRICFFLLKKKLSNQALVLSKMTSVYLKSNDEFSTLVLEQD